MREDVWTADDDRTLLRAKRSGMSYREIAAAYFPTRSWSACKTRARRLTSGEARTIVPDAAQGSARLLEAQLRAGMVAHRARQAWLERHGVAA